MHQLHASGGEGRAGTDEQGIGPLVRKCGESRIDLLAAAGIEHSELQSHGASCRFHVVQRRLSDWSSSRIDEHRHMSRCGYQFAQDLQSLGYKLDCEKIDPRDVAARRERVETRPSLTGSSPTLKTIGIVVVAALAASAETEPPVATMTETGLRASSPASIGSRSSWFSAQRYSIARSGLRNNRSPSGLLEARAVHRRRLRATAGA